MQFLTNKGDIMSEVNDGTAYTKEECVEQLQLKNSEGITGSNGKNISYAYATSIEPCELFSLKGFLVRWKKPGLNSIFVPAENIKTIILGTKKVPVPSKKSKK
jgi:hypothetical protein